jgi:hypothetical protein
MQQKSKLQIKIKKDFIYKIVPTFDRIKFQMHQF